MTGETSKKAANDMKRKIDIIQVFALQRLEAEKFDFTDIREEGKAFLKHCEKTIPKMLDEIGTGNGGRVHSRLRLLRHMDESTLQLRLHGQVVFG